MKELFSDLAPTVGVSVIMMVCVACVGLIDLSPFMKLMLQVLVGMVIYVIGAKCTKNDSFDYLLGIVKRFIKK